MKRTQNGHAQRDWRAHLTKAEAETLALLEWQIGVYDTGRAEIARRRALIVNRAVKRAPPLTNDQRGERG